MAIAFDTSTYLGITNPWTNLTASHTCTGTDRILFVWFFTNSTDDVTSVTYGWVSMTRIWWVQCPWDRWTYLYYLLNPSSGANNVSITTSTWWWAISWIASSYTGAKQSWVPDASQTNSLSWNTSITNTVTTIANNCWTIWVWHPNAWITVTAGAWNTLRQNQATGISMWDSNWPLWVGSTTLWVSNASSRNWAWVMASFAPSTVPSSNFFMFF